MKITISIVLVLFLSGCARSRSVAPPAPPAPLTFLDAVAQIKRSVVPVVCLAPPPAGGNGDWPVASIEGTAFFVSADGSFATAGHVVRELTNPTRRTPCRASAIYVPREGWQRTVSNFRVEYFPFSAAHCTTADDIDIAICRSPRDFRPVMGRDPEPVRFDTALQEDGTPAASTGFPLNVAVPVTSRGFTAAYVQTLDERGPRDLILDIPNWPGGSGSPIYREDGKVIGMILARGTGEAQGATIGRPATFIQRMLAGRR